MNSKNFNFNFKTGPTINFCEETENFPMQPLISASFIPGTEDDISICINIFVNEQENLSTSDIAVIEDEEDPYLFFVIFLRSNMKFNAKNLRNYQITFTKPKSKIENNRNEIKVVAKDKKPTLSRSTKTIVAHSY